MMDEPTTTSILELLYLIRAKNKGELSFAEWLASASSWAAAVIAEHETGQAGAPSRQSLIQADDADGCQNGQ